jgi:hypothetical protein
MSSGFGPESATLLIQDGYGHCSTAHPSLCTAKAIRGYFHEGVVPDYGTTCTSDDGFIFADAYAEAREAGLRAMTEEDREVVRAMRSLAGRMDW